MAHKFIKKDGKYYRINSDKTQTEVQLKDGYFHWTQPDKIRVRAKLDNNLVDMDKANSVMSKIGRVFTNATMSAANADAPAVTTASGWQREKDGSWNQNAVDNPGVNKLRDNIAALSGFAYGAEMEPLVEGAWQLARHPVQTAKSAYRAGKAVVQGTKSLLEKSKARFGSLGITKTSEIAKDAFIDNPVALHLSRIENGGWEKLQQIHKDNPYKENMLAKSPQIRSYSPELNFRMPRQPRHLGDNTVYMSPAELYFDLQQGGGAMAYGHSGNIAGSEHLLALNGYKSPRQIQAVMSHEIDHALHIPLEPAKGFNFDPIDIGEAMYFTSGNNSELAARGSQLKDYFGFTKAEQELTADQLKYAAENYVKDTGIDNNMTSFFKSIADWDEAAKWLNKYATAIGGVVIGTKLYNQDEHNNKKISNNNN